MKYLYPNDVIDNRYGSLVSPSAWSVQKSVQLGKPWASDNDAFTKGFDIDGMVKHLKRYEKYISTCLFVAVPDSVGNWVETKDRFRWVAWKIKKMGFPVAFVAQDGCEFQSWPPEFDTLFIGGSTEWKLSKKSDHCIKRALKMDKRIHIGRVNSWKRYKHFRVLEGSENFTCDGTTVCFAPDKNSRRLEQHEKQQVLFKI